MPVENAGLVRSLIADGASVTTWTLDGATALHFAAALGHTASINQLVIAGADVDAVDSAGNTPLSLALDAGTMRTLLSLGANVRACEQVALYCAIASDDPIRVGLLIDAGADPAMHMFGSVTQPTFLEMAPSLSALSKALVARERDGLNARLTLGGSLPRRSRL